MAEQLKKLDTLQDNVQQGYGRQATQGAKMKMSAPEGRSAQ
jgi:hypothetical protein